MTDGVTAALAAAGLRPPDYGADSLDRVLPAALGALGVEVEPGSPVSGAAQARARFGLPSAERVCVVLVDGLGAELVRERAGHAPFLRHRLPDTRVLTSGFPSTTATSLASFGTGRPPGRTGLLGYTMRNPVTGGLANLVSWTGIEPAPAWQREPALLGLAQAAGRAVTSIGPARFAGSGLTIAVLGGGRYVGAETLDARVDAALRALADPGLVYLYWGDVDKVGHHHGWRSAEWGDALAELDAGLARLARRMPAGTLLLVTADHGHVDVDHERLVDVATTPALAEGVALVAGEPRATYVHLTDEARAELPVVAERWRTVLGDGALVATGDEAVAAGWFGEVALHVRPLVGDLVVAARGLAGVVDSRTQTPASIQLRGMHGSLTPGEMLIPLVVVA